MIGLYLSLAFGLFAVMVDLLPGMYAVLWAWGIEPASLVEALMTVSLIALILGVVVDGLFGFRRNL